MKYRMLLLVGIMIFALGAAGCGLAKSNTSEGMEDIVGCEDTYVEFSSPTELANYCAKSSEYKSYNLYQPNVSLNSNNIESIYFSLTSNTYTYKFSKSSPIENVCLYIQPSDQSTSQRFGLKDFTQSKAGFTKTGKQIDKDEVSYYILTVAGNGETSTTLYYKLDDKYFCTVSYANSNNIPTILEEQSQIDENYVQSLLDLVNISKIE